MLKKNLGEKKAYFISLVPSWKQRETHDSKKKCIVIMKALILLRKMSVIQYHGVQCAPHRRVSLGAIDSK